MLEPTLAWRHDISIHAAIIDEVVVDYIIGKLDFRAMYLDDFILTYSQHSLMIAVCSPSIRYIIVTTDVLKSPIDFSNKFDAVAWYNKQPLSEIIARVDYRRTALYNTGDEAGLGSIIGVL